MPTWWPAWTRVPDSMRGAPTGMRLGLLLMAAVAFWFMAGVAVAQPVRGGGGGGGGGGATPGTAPRLPSLPIIGDELPGGGPPGPKATEDAPHAPDLLIAVFRPGTPDATS